MANEFNIKYRQAAIEATAGSKIFPDTVLSAAALESNWGKSVLSAQYNNFFGIKKGIGWQGRTVLMPTREQRTDGSWYTVNAPFRWYDSPADSFRNYVKFISGPRYVRAGVLNATSPVEQFIAIKNAGYATDVSYVDKLKKVLSSFGDFIQDSATGSATTLAGIAVFFCSLMA